MMMVCMYVCMQARPEDDDVVMTNGGGYVSGVGGKSALMTNTPQVCMQVCMYVYVMIDYCMYVCMYVGAMFE